MDASLNHCVALVVIFAILLQIIIIKFDETLISSTGNNLVERRDKSCPAFCNDKLIWSPGPWIILFRCYDASFLPSRTHWSMLNFVSVTLNDAVKSRYWPSWLNPLSWNHRNWPRMMPIFRGGSSKHWIDIWWKYLIKSRNDLYSVLVFAKYLLVVLLKYHVWCLYLLDLTNTQYLSKEKTPCICSSRSAWSRPTLLEESQNYQNSPWRQKPVSGLWMWACTWIVTCGAGAGRYLSPEQEGSLAHLKARSLWVHVWPLTDPSCDCWAE